MTEQRSDSVIDILRSKLGPRHMSGMDEGRADIERILREELRLERGDAETMVSRMIDDGQLRYVTAAERDPEVDREAQHDERSDRANQVGAGRAPIADVLGAGVVPPTGGPQEGYSGLSTGSAARAAGAATPVAGAGTGTAAAGPLAVTAATDPTLGAGQAGYWDIGGLAAGVVPSSTRKGQVEPQGT